MIDVAEFEPDPATFELPDVPQVNVMMDALDDSIEQLEPVDGVEVMTLTKNQKYAEAVLFSHGIIPHSAMCGMEEGGVFTSIGNGLMGVWNWIKGIFTSIWNFFFSRDNKEDAEKTKKEIDENTAAAKAAADGTQSDEEAKKQTDKMAGIAAANGDQATADTLKAAKTPKEMRAAIKAALPKIAKLNKTARSKIEKSLELAVTAKKGFNKVSEDPANKAYTKAKATVVASDHAVAHILVDLKACVDKILLKDKTFIPILEKALECDTVPKVMAFNTAIKGNIDAMKQLGDDYNAHKGKISEIIQKLDTKIKAAKDKQKKDGLNKEVAPLRVLMNQAVKVSKLIQVSNLRLATVSGQLNELFGI